MLMLNKTSESDSKNLKFDYNDKIISGDTEIVNAFNDICFYRY